MMQKAGGGWPCKLADEGPEGMEMLQRKNGEYQQATGTKAGPSPTSTEVTAWDFMPRGALCLDSVAAALQGSSTSSYLCETGIGEKPPFPNQANQRYGGGVFASLRGAHNTWQSHTEHDASNQRQKHALSLGLAKSRGTSQVEAADGKEGSKPTAVVDAPPAKNDSLMGILIRGLNDEKGSTASTYSSFRPSHSNPRCGGALGVRASAFALVSSNAVVSGRPAPDRHCEAPPRVPLNKPSTREGVAGMKQAAASSSASPQHEGHQVAVTRPRAANAEW